MHTINDHLSQFNKVCVCVCVRACVYQTMMRNSSDTERRYKRKKYFLADKFIVNNNNKLCVKATAMNQANLFCTIIFYTLNNKFSPPKIERSRTVQEAEEKMKGMNEKKNYNNPMSK